MNAGRQPQLRSEEVNHCRVPRPIVCKVITERYGFFRDAEIAHSPGQPLIGRDLASILSALQNMKLEAARVERSPLRIGLHPRWAFPIRWNILRMGGRLCRQNH
jgi:hypothetical protein